MAELENLHDQNQSGFDLTGLGANEAVEELDDFDYVENQNENNVTQPPTSNNVIYEENRGASGAFGEQMGLHEEGEMDDLMKMEMDMINGEGNEASTSQNSLLLSIFLNYDEDEESPEKVDLNKLFQNDNAEFPPKIEVSKHP